MSVTNIEKNCKNLLFSELKDDVVPPHKIKISTEAPSIVNGSTNEQVNTKQNMDVSVETVHKSEKIDSVCDRDDVLPDDDNVFVYNSITKVAENLKNVLNSSGQSKPGTGTDTGAASKNNQLTMTRSNSMKNKRKRRRGKAKRKTNIKPFLTNWKYPIPKSGRRFNNMLSISGYPIVPYNTNKFLMEEHMPEIPTALMTPSGRTRDSSFSVDSEENYFYSLPEDEEEFLTKEFSSVYEDAKCERLEGLSKAQLMQEYLQLESNFDQLSKRLNEEANERNKDAKEQQKQMNCCEYENKIKILEEQVKELTAENLNLSRQLEFIRRSQQKSPGNRMCSSSSSSVDSESDSSSSGSSNSCSKASSRPSSMTCDEEDFDISMVGNRNAVEMEPLCKEIPSSAAELSPRAAVSISSSSLSSPESAVLIASPRNGSNAGQYEGVKRQLGSIATTVDQLLSSPSHEIDTISPNLT